jgi:hypothetical protein
MIETPSGEKNQIDASQVGGVDAANGDNAAVIPATEDAHPQVPESSSVSPAYAEKYAKMPPIIRPLIQPYLRNLSNLGSTGFLHRDPLRYNPGEGEATRATQAIQALMPHLMESATQWDALVSDDQVHELLAGLTGTLGKREGRADAVNYIAEVMADLQKAIGGQEQTGEQPQQQAAEIISATTKVVMEAVRPKFAEAMLDAYRQKFELPEETYQTLLAEIRQNNATEIVWPNVDDGMMKELKYAGGRYEQGPMDLGNALRELKKTDKLGERLDQYMGLIATLKGNGDNGFSSFFVDLAARNTDLIPDFVAALKRNKDNLIKAGNLTETSIDELISTIEAAKPSSSPTT